MGGFFDFFNTHRGGIFVFLSSLLVVVLVVGLTINWLAWLFSWGRFKNLKPTERSHNLRYIFSDAIVKIINDFRHLLALVIVSIFAFVLVYSMIRAGGDTEKMKDSIQVVVASLGGLVGSIIGYYFGESAVAKANEAKGTLPSQDVGKIKGVGNAAEPIPNDVQQDDDSSIANAPPPPILSAENK